MKGKVKLSGPLVTTTVQLAAATDLPVTGINFLLGNGLDGGRVLVPTPTVCGVPEELGSVVPDFVGVVTHSQTRRVKEVATAGTDCNKAETPQKESINPILNELKPGSPVSQGVGADCDRAKQP